MERKQEPQLTISTLRQELARLQHEHGDLPVVVNDSDTGWVFLLKASHLDVEEADNAQGKKLALSADDGDEQEA